jgi:hypothetical protein
MRRLLVVAVLAAAGFVGLGISQGWLLLSAGETDEKPSLVVAVDLERIAQDLGKVREAGQQLKEKANAAATASKEGTPRP